MRRRFAIVRRRKPAVVLGVGGFVTGPGGVAAWLLGRPLVIHEQNAIAGLTNRCWRASRAQVLEGFPGSFPRGVPVRMCIGNPVRRDIAALPAPEQRFADAQRRRCACSCIGGSLGARAPQQQSCRGARALLQRQGRPRSLASGRRARTSRRRGRRTRQAGVNARVDAFIEDMAGAYAWADLVICRAGALTVAELAAAGLGAILVPFPSAVDDHQTHNARYLTEAGAAVLIPEPS